MPESPVFTAWLTAELTRRGWDASRLAAYSGIEYNTIYRWTKGTGIDPLNVTPLARALGFAPEDVMRVLGWLPRDEMGEAPARYVAKEVDPRVVPIALALAGDEERLETWFDLGETLVRRRQKELESRP